MEFIVEVNYEEFDIDNVAHRCHIKFIDGTTATYTTEEDMIAVHQQLVKQVEMTKGM